MKPEAKWYYYLLAAPIYMLVLLPFPLFYLLADCLSFIAYRVIKYRRAVVMENLQLSFPEKNTQELEAIAKAYYTNMIDVFMETFKALVLSKQNMIKRASMDNIELLQGLHQQGKSVILMLGHVGNWEWGGFSFVYQLGYPAASLYHPLSNAFFNWLTFRLRSRCGMGLIPMQQSARDFLTNKNKVRTVAFIADQSPPPEHAYWMNFLNQETGFFTGGAKLAVKYNMAVVYTDVVRVKRGYYTIRFSLITDEPTAKKPNEITEIFGELLAKSIQQNPSLWLWSHKRWKHKRIHNQ
ncbi:MAG: lipid A biosynthesis acyltransferase [Bacteroidetes bacterium]|nr:MAG: lipid A biosynthesis acyltransferase [Bacteroidota bacterium]